VLLQCVLIIIELSKLLIHIKLLLCGCLSYETAFVASWFELSLSAQAAEGPGLMAMSAVQQQQQQQQPHIPPGEILETAERLREIGNDKFNKGDLNEAITIYEKVQKYSPSLSNDSATLVSFAIIICLFIATV